MKRLLFIIVIISICFVSVAQQELRGWKRIREGTSYIDLHPDDNDTAVIAINDSLLIYFVRGSGDIHIEAPYGKINLTTASGNFMLDTTSDGNRIHGFQQFQMTPQSTAPGTYAHGEFYYDPDDSTLYVRTEHQWWPVGSGSGISGTIADRQMAIGAGTDEIEGFDKYKTIGINVLEITNAAGDTGILITNPDVDNVYTSGIRIDNPNTGEGIQITNSGSGQGIDLSNSSSGYGIYISNTSGHGIWISQFTSGNGLTGIVQSGSSGKGIYVKNESSSGTGLDLWNTSTGVLLDIDNDAAGMIFDIDNDAAGTVLDINNISTGKPIYIHNGATTLFQVESTGRITIADTLVLVKVIKVKSNTANGGDTCWAALLPNPTGNGWDLDTAQTELQNSWASYLDSIGEFEIFFATRDSAGELNWQRWKGDCYHKLSSYMPDFSSQLQVIIEKNFAWDHELRQVVDSLKVEITSIRRQQKSDRNTFYCALFLMIPLFLILLFMLQGHLESRFRKIMKR